MFHRDPLPPLNRRDMLRRIGAGFGTLGLANALSETAQASERDASPLAPKPPHFAPRAKHVIQLFMPGGPSQVDTFDYKPQLAKCQGQRPELVDRNWVTGSEPKIKTCQALLP